MQGRNEVRGKMAPPFSNLMSFGSKRTTLQTVLVTLLRFFGAPVVIRRPRNCALPSPLRYAPATMEIHFTRKAQVTDGDANRDSEEFS